MRNPERMPELLEELRSLEGVTRVNGILAEEESEV